ncbi:hypothetical protein BaRGS_00014654 [Batillaria attramentaria]|uniref:Uncharacterized protein n=1 Tax=Batillaria attramentaria TaxID=370345 RepID=A0ABD0L4K7_9CAEN
MHAEGESNFTLFPHVRTVADQAMEKYGECVTQPYNSVLLHMALCQIHIHLTLHRSESSQSSFDEAVKSTDVCSNQRLFTVLSCFMDCDTDRACSFKQTTTQSIQSYNLLLTQ